MDIKQGSSTVSGTVNSLDQEWRFHLKCFFCKKYINPKRDRYIYMIFRTVGGFLRKLTWCIACDETRRDKIDVEYDRRLKIDEEYMRRIRSENCIQE